MSELLTSEASQVDPTASDRVLDNLRGHSTSSRLLKSGQPRYADWLRYVAVAVAVAMVAIGLSFGAAHVVNTAQPAGGVSTGRTLTPSSPATPGSTPRPPHLSLAGDWRVLIVGHVYRGHQQVRTFRHRYMFITFGRHHRFHGNDGCHNFRGSYQATGTGALRFRHVFTDFNGCVPDPRLAARFDRIRFVERSGASLLLMKSNHEIYLVLKPTVKPGPRPETSSPSA